MNQLECFLDRGVNELLQVLTTVVLIGAMFFVLAPWYRVGRVPPDPVDPVGFVPVPAQPGTALPRGPRAGRPPERFAVQQPQRHRHVDSLRRAIGLVSQDVFLFHGTVRDNIAYGRPEASFEEIVTAAEIAEAHGFVSTLPEGYDTLVGERGQKLSGGQRQRVSLARALLADPPILILDEATSAVDNETEAAIQRSLARIASGRTVLAIAHRLSTVRHADRIDVLTGGRIVESGTHDELVASDGLYTTLWRVQTGEVLAPPVA